MKIEHFIRVLLCCGILLLVAVFVSFNRAPAVWGTVSLTPVPTPVPFTSGPIVDPFVCDVSPENPVNVCHAMLEADAHEAQDLAAQSSQRCVNGVAGGIYPCENVDLLSFVPLAEFDSHAANDIWGWTDPDTGREYALIGLNDGTAFVDVTDPADPQVLGKLPTHAWGSPWRDIKVYRNHAYIVADNANVHGMQIFDLTQLRTVETFTTFEETAHYDAFGSAHNIIINEESGTAFVVGIQTGTTCSGGLHIIDLTLPTAPSFAGCFSTDGYTHDAQCVNYHGPDTEHVGKELCFNANTDSVAIVDVSDRSNLEKLSESTYSGVAYTHQLWLTQDHRYMLVNDELDERSFLTPGGRAETFIWDVSDIDKPKLIDSYVAVEPSVDHNLYIDEQFVYQANYQTGLRILGMSDIASGDLKEVGYFDTYTLGNQTNFNGAWSNYPFFESGIIIVSSIEQGLFVLDYNPLREQTFLPMVAGLPK